MNIEEAKQYIRMIIRKKEIPDSAKTLGYVYANEAIETILAELDKKDRIIDDMAKMIDTHDIDEDVCGQFGKNKDCSDYTNEELCVNCIKEYFEKKVGKVE